MWEWLRSLFLGLALTNPALSNTDPGYIKKHAIDAYRTWFSDKLVEQILPVDVVLVGEMHGSSEMPEFALDIAKNHKRAGNKVTLALEIPANYQPIIDVAIKEKSLEKLAGSEFFRSDFPDGRSSFAMALLVKAAAEFDIGVLCFDRATDVSTPDRDLTMAENIAAFRIAHPEHKLVVLAGNYHSRTEDKVADPAFTPMGYYLSHLAKDAIPREKILNIMARAQRGSYWACFSSNGAECGIKDI